MFTKKNNQNDLAPEELSAIKNSLQEIQVRLKEIHQTLDRHGLLSASRDTADYSRLAQELDSRVTQTPEGPERVVEGVFDGQNMVGPDGRQYSVPANYSSKSKLVEGDILKLTITPAGSFIYKQIEPALRERLMGTLNYNETTGQYQVVSDRGGWQVLAASVTYFRGQPGDEAVILVPKGGQSKWAAVENIIHTN